MIVYRLEGDDWYGVWSSGTNDYYPYLIKKDFTATHTGGCTVDRYNLPLSFDYRFGCDSIDQLKEYFGQSFYRLLSAGFAIARYIVSESDVIYGRGNKELVFNANEAERVYL